nr:reverse transcriptase domain-containing protein [Tanacetum cinerariifolium]
MANTTPIVITVMKTANKKKTPKEADAALKANILDFCEEHYEDILPVIMDKIRRDKRKEVRLDFGKNPRKSRRVRESSQNSSAGTLPARYRNPSERPKMRDRLKYNDEDVFNRLSHRRQSAFDRLSNTYLLSITKSGPNEGNSRDRSHSRGRSRTSSRDRPRNKNRPRGIKESYGNTRSSYRAWDRHGYHARDRDRSCSMKKGRKSESPLSRVSESGTSDGGHWKTRAKRRKPADEEDLSTRMPNNVKTYDGTGDLEDHLKIFQAAEQVERWAMPTWCHIFNSTLIGAARVWFDELPPESIDEYKGLKAAFLAYFMQQKKYVKDPVEIHNIKQRDGETINEFIKRFKIEIERMKGAPECMRISGFMHGVNNPELTKRLNEHVPKTVEEMMTATTAFMLGETDAASTKKVHTPWKSQDQSKRHTSESRSDFRNQPKDGRGSNKDTPLTITPKEIFAAESGKFKPPSPMRVTRQKVTQSFTHVKEITFPPLTANKGTEGPLVIEAEIEHYTKAWMNFMRVRSPSPYNGIIGRPGIREIQAVPSTAYGMLKFPVNGGIVSICSTILTSTECATIAATPKDSAKKTEARHENFKVAIHPDFLDQEITIGGTTKKTRAGPGACQSNPSRGTKTVSGRNSARSILPCLVIQPGHAPKPKEGLIMYLSASYGAISAVLMTERDAVQKPVYFASQALQAPELNYTPMEKLVLALVCAAKRSRRYFQAHLIVVLADQPIKQTSVKGQILADFLVEKPDDAPPETSVIKTPQDSWTLYTNGSRSFLKPWLRCVGPLQADYVIREIHEGSCSMHVGPRSVVAKAMRSGYYWPTMHRDTQEMIRKCKDCQIYCPVPRHPQQPLTPITAPWPFYKCGIDVAGPFPKGPGKVKFLIAAMDYFTKWIEAKVVATITGSQVKKFVWDNIVCHFDSPGRYSRKMLNRLLKRTNRSLGEGIKARLGEGNKNLLEELLHVLWSHRTMINSSNENTSFSLTYGTEAVILEEIRMPTYRITVADVMHNDEELQQNLDLLEERRERSVIREAKAKLKMTKYYNARVRVVTFRPGDFVYHSNDASHAMDGGKLGPKWKGPYEVTKALGDGAYKLRSTDGTVLSRTWNISSLKNCYL